MSESLKWFRDGFRAKYGLTEYTDISAPTVFVGVYGTENAKLIKAHKGFKLVMFCGSDIMHAPLLKDVKIDGFLSDMHIYEKEIAKWLNVPKYATVPIKSFDMFTPQPLGDKIYFYARVKKAAIEKKFKMNIIDSVIRRFGKDKVLLGYQGNTIEQMRDNFYAKSFINLNFTREVGFTTCLEMAHMGRKTISMYPARFCAPYDNEKKILTMIDFETKRIGTVREDIARFAREYYTVGNDWLNLDYWRE